MTRKIRYLVSRKLRSGATAYYWAPQDRFITRGFPGRPEALGQNFELAAAKADLLNKQLDAWRGNEEPEESVRLGDRGYIYFLKCGQRIKIGFSKNPFARVDSLRTGMSSQVESCAFMRGTKADEQKLHQRLDAYRLNGEWFANSRHVRRVMLMSLARGKAHHECRDENVSSARVETFQLSSLPDSA